MTIANLILSFGSAEATPPSLRLLGKWSCCTPLREELVKINSDYSDLLRVFAGGGVSYRAQYQI